jgi:hypothetical protein
MTQEWSERLPELGQAKENQGLAEQRCPAKKL